MSAHAIRGPFNVHSVYVVTGSSHTMTGNSSIIFTNPTASVAPTVTLVPAASELPTFFVWIQDIKGDAATNNVTVTPSGTDTINGVNSSLVITSAYGGVMLKSVSGGWVTTDIPANFNPVINTAITTVGAGTLTAAAIAGGVITRSGSTADYTDTTATAAQIIAAKPGIGVGYAWELVIRNTVNFAETITGGSGVTVSGITVIPPLSSARFLVTYSAAGAVTMVGISNSPQVCLPPAKYTLNTAGVGTAAAGELTGAQYVCLGLQNNSAYAYTTRTATQMFGDIPNCAAGYSYMVLITNTGNNTVTLTAGSGVTITGTATLATNTTRLFNVKFTSSSACTFQSVQVGTIS